MRVKFEEDRRLRSFRTICRSNIWKPRFETSAFWKFRKTACGFIDLPLNARASTPPSTHHVFTIQIGCTINKSDFESYRVARSQNHVHLESTASVERSNNYRALTRLGSRFESTRNYILGTYSRNVVLTFYRNKKKISRFLKVLPLFPLTAPDRRRLLLSTAISPFFRRLFRLILLSGVDYCSVISSPISFIRSRRLLYRFGYFRRVPIA